MTGTLGTLIAEHYSVTAYCNDCGHRSEIDLEAMALMYGERAAVRGSNDLGPARIGGRALVCGACQARNTALRISPGGLPNGRL